MKKLLVLVMLLGLPAWAQEGKDKEKKKGDAPREDGKEKKGDAPRENRKDEGRGAGACGKGRAEIFDAMKKEGLGGDDLEGFVDSHFKARHPDGPCHCNCGHEKEAAPPKPAHREGEDCGRTIKQILSGPRIDENKVADHFKRHHPKGEACHCSCGHEKEGGKPKEKGNNGVGNGEDPQPPGKPPVNDGPGSKPGKPGNKGGDKR